MFAVVAQEFKKFYNAAKDDAQGRKPPAPAAAKGRDSKGLDSSTNDARQRLKEEKARKKAEEAEKIRAAPAAWLRCPREEALARSRPRGRPSYLKPSSFRWATIWACGERSRRVKAEGRLRRRSGACPPLPMLPPLSTRQENAAMKARMKEKAKAGGDSKSLDADLLAARKEAADKRKAEKEAAAAKMAAENKAQKAKLKKCAPPPAPARAPACGGTRRARSALAHAAQWTANWHIHCKSMACAFCSAARGPAPTTTCWTTWRPTAHRWRMRGTRRRRRAQTPSRRAPRTPRTARRS